MTKYINTQVKKIETPVPFWTCVLVLFMLAGLYVFFISGTVANTMEYKNLSIKADIIATKIVDKEAIYANNTLSIDREYASFMGFVEANSSNVYYIPMQADVVAISFNEI